MRAGAVGLLVTIGLGAGRGASAKRFRLRETAGLRRFGYPVHATFPAAGEGAAFRLTGPGGRLIPAQFRPTTGPDGEPAVVVDFVASPGPFEVQDYVLHQESGAPAADPPGGMRVEHRDGHFRVANGPGLHFDVPDDLLGFLRGVGGGLDYVAEGSRGLWIRDGQGHEHRVGGASIEGTVARQGPLAVALGFRGSTALGSGRRVGTEVSLTFPSSKSWVEATLVVDDPDGQVAGLGLDLGLVVEGEPTLVDLGASSTVYGHIRGAERMALEAGGRGLGASAWTAFKGPPGRLEALASGLPPAVPGGARPAIGDRSGDLGRAAEGWAHVMDRRRCTAIAVAGFGRTTRDRIEVEADGRARVLREFLDEGAGERGQPRKALTLWLHFVGMPVQVGAATSPQAALAPLEVVRDPKDD